MIKGHRYAQVPGREGYVSCKSCKSTKKIAQLNMAGKCAYAPEYAEGNSIVWVARVKGHRLKRSYGESYSAACTHFHKEYLGMPRKPCDAVLVE